MAEVVSLKPTLSDSAFKTRPNFRAYIQTDQNAGLDMVELFEARRRARQMKLPTMTGQHAMKSFTEPMSSKSFVKWNDEGDHRSSVPTRFYSNMIDPVSGFISPGADIQRNTGVSKLKSFAHVSDTPQDNNPLTKHTVRMPISAPPELRRQDTAALLAPSLWNSRKTLDISTRAKLGGWTSDKDPRSLSSGNKDNNPNSPPSKNLKENLAMQYMYKSSTQQQYEEVPWDNMLAPKMWAPTTTLEPKADQVDQRHKLRRYATIASEHQLVGRSWDWFQKRNGYYKNPQWIDYTSPCPRAQQIPLYGGCTGGDNLDDIDNQYVGFTPYTVKRVNVPREAETSHRPNIPGYTGCTLYRSPNLKADPSNSMRNSPPATKSVTPPTTQTTTGVAHQSLPSTHQLVNHKRDAVMSKMVTTVPPCNPFNKLDFMPPSKALK